MFDHIVHILIWIDDKNNNKNNDKNGNQTIKLQVMKTGSLKSCQTYVICLYRQCLESISLNMFVFACE